MPQPRYDFEPVDDIDDQEGVLEELFNNIKEVLTAPGGDGKVGVSIR